MAVCLGGAALCNPGNGGALFARLLAQVPSTARFLVSVVCGNHVYNNRFGDAMHFAVEGFGAEARGRSLTHFAVVGMSPATWQYESRFAAQYDADATALLDAFRAGGVFAGSGAAELPNLELSDSIGHVHPNSSRTAFDASKVWLQKCIALAIPPPLPRVEPLLPPACPAVPATPIAQQHEFFDVFADGASLDVTCTTA